MFENLDVFTISSAMAQHAGTRQALLSQNVANANTPGYLAQDLPSFKSSYEMNGSATQKATRTGHLNGAELVGDRAPMSARSAASPDGNTVSVEQQMLKATETIRQHDQALAIYKSALGVLRSSLGRR
jgi:flagellar basal-body rod protein FlgB